MHTILPLSARGGMLETSTSAQDAETAGFDTLSISEISSDPMLQLTVAAQATRRIRLMTNIVVAFARSPMTLALQATNLQEYSGGRLVLGLGSQVRPHIERRFSMPWSAPAKRMEEYVRALRAIWRTWETGEPLRVEGEFYTHTLMIPEYAPAVSHPRPEVFVAAVGQRMTEAAGAVADGVIVHAFTTREFLEQVTIPALQRGSARSERSDDRVRIVANPFLVSGFTPEEIGRSRELVRSRIAFYGSTTAYRPVLELHGWGAVGEELNRMSKTDDPERWERMSDLITDEMLATFAVEGPADQVGALLSQRFDGLVDSISINPMGLDDRRILHHLAEAIREDLGPLADTDHPEKGVER